MAESYGTDDGFSNFTTTATQFGFGGMSPGIELKFDVDGKFWSDPDAYQARLQRDIQQYLRDRAAARAGSRELLEEYGDAPLVEVVIEDGSVWVKVYLTTAWVALALAGCAAPQQPSFRQETHTVLTHVKTVASDGLREFKGELRKENVIFGQVADIDAAFEQYADGSISADALVIQIHDLLDPMNERPETPTLQVATLVYIQERYGHALSRLPKNLEVSESRVAIVVRVEVRVEPAAGVTPEDFEREAKDVVVDETLPSVHIHVHEDESDEDNGPMVVVIIGGVIAFFVQYIDFWAGVKAFLQDLDRLRKRARAGMSKLGKVRHVKIDPYPVRTP